MWATEAPAGGKVLANVSGRAVAVDTLLGGLGRRELIFGGARGTKSGKLPKTFLVEETVAVFPIAWDSFSVTGDVSTGANTGLR